MPLVSSATIWFDSTNNAIGMVTFATVLYMFCSDMWQLDFHPRTWVRLMIYLDAIAFAISYSGNMVDDLLPLCSQKYAYSIVADLIWSMKDAVKYGYIAFRSMTICGFKYRQTKRPCYTAAAISAVLYWILMAQVYSFNDSTNCAAYFKSNIPRVLLYSYWTLVDVVAAVGVIRKMRNAILEAQRLELDDTMDRHAFSILKFREELRLILVSVSMIAVTVVVIVQTTNPELPTYRVGTMVFVYCQLILVIGSKKVEVGARDSAVDYGDLGEQIQTVVRNISQRKREEQMITRQSFSQNQTNSLVV